MFEQKKLYFGIALITLSAIGYGLQPVFGKLAYANNISPSTITFGRFLFAALLFELHYFFLNSGLVLPKKDLIVTLLIALVFTLAGFCYYISLQYLSPIVFTFVYYTYPLITLLVGIAFFNEKLSKSIIIGCALMLIGTLFLLSSGNLEANYIGIIWILACSLCMAFFFNLQRYLSTKRCGLFHAKVMIRTMAVLFFIWWLFDGMPNLEYSKTNIQGWFWVFMIGLLSTYVAFTASVVGISYLGPSYAVILSAQEPLWTTFFSVWALGSTLTGYQCSGAIIILIAVVYINYTRKVT